MINNKNNKDERTKNPLRINEIIRREYPLLAELIENNKKIKHKQWQG